MFRCQMYSFSTLLNHGWTRINTDYKIKIICAHPWLSVVPAKLCADISYFILMIFVPSPVYAQTPVLGEFTTGRNISSPHS